MTDHVEPHELRARFARSLSAMYGQEVPAYTTLVDVTNSVNADVARRMGKAVERLGALDRVSVERHGAIRLGTPREMAHAAQVFAAMEMHPVGFYDLRDEAASSLPVIATAFRPTSSGELAHNPFRVFTSLLTTSDRRYFDADLQRRLEGFLAQRVVFGAELLELAAQGEREHGLPADRADRFLQLATSALELSRDPVDGRWYRELEQVSAVAADIGGVASTHINHLTPRVLDIDELYARMQQRGVEMIDAIQGPPAWDGPDVLLRQTSFRALAEPRRFRTSDGRVEERALRVRFGEVESRGTALTAAGRALYDDLSSDVVRWRKSFPATERDLIDKDLGFFSFEVAARDADGTHPPAGLAALLDEGWVTATPITYEDFLPRSAAGIFRSNLTEDGYSNRSERGAELDVAWLSEVLNRSVADPMALYACQRDSSLTAVSAALAVEVGPPASSRASVA